MPIHNRGHQSVLLEQQAEIESRPVAAAAAAVVVVVVVVAEGGGGGVSTRAVTRWSTSSGVTMIGFAV